MAKTAAPKTMESNHKIATVLSTGLFAILGVLIAFPLLAGFFASFQEGREVVMKGMSPMWSIYRQLKENRQILS